MFDYQINQQIIAKVSKSWSTISISRTTGLKNVFVIMTLSAGAPINGIAFGLLDGALVGVSVQKSKFVFTLVYTYLGDIWFGFDRFAVTGSQKKLDVTIL